MIIQRGSFGLLFFMSERLPGSTKYPIFVHHQKTMYMKRTFFIKFYRHFCLFLLRAAKSGNVYC